MVVLDLNVYSGIYKYIVNLKGIFSIEWVWEDILIFC